LIPPIGRRSRSCRRSRIRVGVALALVAPLFFACQREIRVGRPYNVVLIAIDTLRWDHTSLTPSAHEGRDLTPNLRRLAERGTVFEHAVSQAPWTMPALASVLTGQYPREHGAISQYGGLPDSAETLAELLHDAGYRTGGVASGYYAESVRGFGRGFDSFDDTNSLPNDESSSLEGEQQRPFFLFAHYFDPHYQYLDHPDWNYVDGYDGWLLESERDIESLRANSARFEARDIEFLKDLYDEEIRFVDQQIGRLLGFLETAGIADRTLVVVVADHGEEFLERGWLGHTRTLHRELVQVPLVIALPERGSSPRSVANYVETRQIFATVLDVLEVASTDVDLEASLVPLLRPRAVGRVEREAPVYSEVWLPDSEEEEKRVQLSSVISDGWKLILDHRTRVEQLYDLSTDPGETRDLARENEERLRSLRRTLSTWLSRMPGSFEEGRWDLDEEQRQRLKELGYL
jgi:arylsulfatase A-like enzyme